MKEIYFHTYRDEVTHGHYTIKTVGDWTMHADAVEVVWHEGKLRWLLTSNTFKRKWYCHNRPYILSIEPMPNNLKLPLLDNF